jgi:AcrR family transcriptional regulator
VDDQSRVGRRLTGAERRQQLLDATARLVVESGFHSVSVESVARAAGISRPIVYEHFGDLAGLLEALMHQMLERALVQLAEVLPTSLPPDDSGAGLVEALRGYLEVVGADPGTWKLVLMPPEGAPETLRAAIGLGRQAVVDRLSEALAGRSTGGSVSPDPDLTARLLSAIADECARLMLNDPGHFDMDRITRHARWFLESRAGAQRL